MSTARVQSLLTRVCLASGDVMTTFTRDPHGFALAHGLAPEDASAIAEAAPRIGLYRKLVRGNVHGVVAAILERTRARFEAFAPGIFDSSVDAFLAEAGPRTPHLRDVPRELLAHALPRWREHPSLPAFVPEHAELEYLEFAVSVAPGAAPPRELLEVAPDRALVFSSPTELVTFRHAVHELPHDAADAVAAPRPTTLLAYRDEDHRARFLELTPLAAAIVARVREGAPLAEAVAGGAGALGATLDERVIADVARLLADLGTRGVLLGARAL